MNTAACQTQAAPPPAGATASAAAARWRDVRWAGFWRTSHPLWLCAFRPLFALTVLAAPALVLPWLLFLLAGWPLPAVAGGPLAWHAHELLLGLGLAAVAGFLLTAVPEFTDTPAFTAAVARPLAALWLAMRALFWCSGAWPWLAWPLAALHSAFMLLLFAALWPRLWQSPERRHLSFAWALALLWLAGGGFYWQALLGNAGGTGLPWLHGVLGVLMLLIVLALSRISMSIVNESLDALQARDEQGEPLHYLARRPRRNLAMLCIGLHTLAQLLQWPATTTGWLALAAAAAVLNLLNDWHVGRALLRRWPLMLYAVYALMAAGYALIGLSGLGLAVPAAAGTHLLAAGAFGLNILAVLVIAGYTHSGLEKNGRAWVPWAAAAVTLAAVLRALAYWLAAAWPLALAGLLWAGGFALLGWHMLPVWLTPRTDGAQGCAGVAET